MSSGSNPPPGANYPRTSTYLQLVRERIPNNVDSFIQLFSLISYLHTYLTTNNPDDLRSGTLRTPFIAVMEEVKRMKEVFEADEPLKDAYVLFEVEMVHVLGQVKIREDKAKAKKGWLTAAAGGALLTVGTVVVGPALAVGGLKLIGFRSVGPLAGSIAARVQSVVYGGAVRSGSIFALCQSAAMGGIAVGSAAEVAAGVAALGAGAGLLGVFGGSDKNDGDDARSNEVEPNNGQVP